MSENLDLVRSIYTDWERGDYSRVDWADPEIKYVIVGGPSPGSWTGLAGMAQGWRSIMEVFTKVHSEVEDVRELDEERVLALARTHGAQGRTSGIDIDEVGGWRHAALFEFRHGNVTRLAIYFDRERALADLGLAPEADAL
jgi:hypothetical protein